MALLGDDGKGFNSGDHKPFAPIPSGKYLVIIEESELKETRNGNGEYLELKMQVIDGEYKGRYLWDRLNLKNSNAEAVKMANGTLSSICRAVGVPTPNDSIELHDLPLVARVTLKPRADTGELSNEIKAYSAKPRVGEKNEKTGEVSKTAGERPW